jgi:sn-glycerol 3-phosphate transport system ATP-binding protein
VASVTLDNVRKSFGPVDVIHGVSVDIKDGEFVVIVGPSGCGKSTLLRMVAGLEDVTSGTIGIGGRSVEKLGPKDRDIAMVFQNYALYPHMSVYDNLAYGLKMRRVPKAEIGPRVKRASEILEITEYLDRKPRNLSGGQRQRVAMGRAIVRDPAVFLFDEPLSNLDAKLRVQMRLEIKALQQSLGTTSIYVTHDQVEAMTLADRLIVMNKGNAEQIGPPMEVYEDPATTFVAGFIGSPAMNFLKARVGDDRTIEVDAGSGGAFAVGLATKGLDPGRPVLLGVRPEHLVTAAERAAGAIPLDVHVAEPLGADTLLYGRIGSHPEVIAARLAGHQRNVTGRRAWFTAAVEHCFLFDAATGARLR